MELNKENIFQAFFKGVKNKYKKGTELTSRTDFENFLNGIKPKPSIKIFHDPKKHREISGKPDFRVEVNGLTIGYIETKAVDTDLDQIMNPKREDRESEQLKKYLNISSNLLLTNYHEFLLFKNGKLAERQRLFYLSDSHLGRENIHKVETILNAFFTFSPEKVKNPEKLSELLAERTKLFRDFLTKFLEDGEESNFKKKLVGDDGLYQLMQKTLVEDLKKGEFVDAYVQTISYGLFLARLNSAEPIKKESSFRFIPQSMGILRELFKTIEIEDIPDNIGWIIEQIINILNFTDINDLKQNLSFSKTYDDKDPYVYFYENFLGKYDKSKRKAKGVYYTPIPVVRFIDKSIGKLLRKEFKVTGFEDSRVTVLDFATGTGTFLLEAFKEAIEATDSSLKKRMIREHLLKAFFGFEYLIAPYAVAHLKLSQFLQDNGYILDEKERLQVYLTDTLDDAEHKMWSLFPMISKEGQEANKIKLKDPILAVIGNPPYSNYSRNNKHWIRHLIKDYKEGLDERKINLDDDYIKFIRYAHWKIENTGRGVVGIITNNSYIDGITHRVMRKKLLEIFDKVYILNLHGNSERREPDTNVFDIQKGVCISIFLKLPKPLEKKEVYYYSTLGNGLMSREDKFKFLSENDINSISWQALQSKEPDYWFARKDFRHEKEYEKGWSLADIFHTYGSGVKTDRDGLFIDLDKEKLARKIRVLLSGKYDKDFADKYRVENSSSYNLLDKLRNNSFEPNCVKGLHFRPFDYRHIYYKVGLTSRPAFEVAKHFLMGRNIGLVSVRQVAEKDFNHAFVTDKIADIRVTLSNRGTAYIFPLYVYDEETESPQEQLKIAMVIKERESSKNPYKDMNPQPNFTENFIKFIVKNWQFIPTPEEIFGYIYAILHSPTYRKRYQEHLRTKFPQIPFTKDTDKFGKMAKLGNLLIESHLLKRDSGNAAIGKIHAHGDVLVGYGRFNEKTNRLYINENQYFENISEDLFNFEIGGYKVLDKWLKERKGMKLSYDDITHFQKMANSLHETKKIMLSIDEIFKTL